MGGVNVEDDGVDFLSGLPFRFGDVFRNGALYAGLDLGEPAFAGWLLVDERDGDGDARGEMAGVQPGFRCDAFEADHDTVALGLDGDDAPDDAVADLAELSGIVDEVPADFLGLNDAGHVAVEPQVEAVVDFEDDAFNQVVGFAGVEKGRPGVVCEVLAAESAVGRTNAQLVQEIANRAEAWGGRQGLGLGSRAGTLKHGYADRLLTRYQRLYGDRGLSTEIPYLNGQAGVGGRGSIRLDVVEGPFDNPTAIFDYKFGGATLTPDRIQQIRRVGQFGPNVPISPVHP